MGNFVGTTSGTGYSDRSAGSSSIFNKPNDDYRVVMRTDAKHMVSPTADPDDSNIRLAIQSLDTIIGKVIQERMDREYRERQQPQQQQQLQQLQMMHSQMTESASASALICNLAEIVQQTQQQQAQQQQSPQPEQQPQQHNQIDDAEQTHHQQPQQQQQQQSKSKPQTQTTQQLLSTTAASAAPLYRCPMENSSRTYGVGGKADNSADKLSYKNLFPRSSIDSMAGMTGPSTLVDHNNNNNSNNCNNNNNNNSNINNINNNNMSLESLFGSMTIDGYNGSNLPLLSSYKIEEFFDVEQAVAAQSQNKFRRLSNHQSTGVATSVIPQDCSAATMIGNEPPSSSIRINLPEILDQDDEITILRLLIKLLVGKVNKLSSEKRRLLANVSALNDINTEMAAIIEHALLTPKRKF